MLRLLICTFNNSNCKKYMGRMNQQSSKKVGVLRSSLLRNRKASKPAKQVFAAPLKKGSNRKQKGI